jgi:hypothetical protein
VASPWHARTDGAPHRIGWTRGERPQVVLQREGEFWLKVEGEHHLEEEAGAGRPVVEVAASERPEREETKSSARYASPRPFREWQPEQGQMLPRYAASLRLTLNNRHPLPVPAHGRGLSQRGMGASEEVLDMTGEVMSWSPMVEVGPRNARIERRMGDASARAGGVIALRRAVWRGHERWCVN